MKRQRIDLRGLDPLEPAHLIKMEQGLAIGCEEMEHLRENQYQCVDNNCQIVYRHLQFVGYLPRDLVDIMSLALGREVMKCKPRCLLLKRNTDCNFVCKICGGYWYLLPSQKFMLSLDDLYIQDSRVVKFLIGKLQESVKTMREVDTAVLRERWRTTKDFSARTKIAMIEKLESHLSQLLKIYRI